jgi:hypothetical protein
MGDPQMRKTLWVMVVLCACLGLTTGASAALVDTFDYGDGALLTNNGWIAHSGAGTQPIDVFSPGLAYPLYPTSSVVGQAARLDNNGEDAYKPYAQSAGVVYYAFLVNVASPTAGYFAMLNGSATDFWARVNVAPATGGMYLGISNTSTAPAAYPAIYALNTTHLVVVKFDFATGFASLWVNPSLATCLEPTPDLVSATAVAGKVAIGFALRQFVASELIYVDGLRIGTTWQDVLCSAPPTGSCCAPDGTCSVVEQAACAGVWTAGGVCVPNPCPQLGTCCALDGSCTFVLQANCSGAWTLGGTCNPSPCTQPVGSCCAADGTCTLTLASACTGTWTQGGLCDPNTCAQPSGSCCDPLGGCTVTLAAGCTGVWTMFGVCVPNPCPLPTGACCLPAGTCVVGLETDCVGVGVYQGNFTLCTPNPCPAPVHTLCEVAEDDMNGVAVLVGQRVTVQGIALCDGMTWSTTTREFQISDGTCCIDVFGGGLVPAVALGDLVQVTGTVANYNGKTEISTPDMTVVVLSSGNPVPTPGVTTTGALAAAGEPFESCLFTIYCVSIVSGTWPAAGLDANIVIDDGTGPVTMRIDKDTNIDGSPAPTGPFTVTGIGDQYDTTSPYTTGWQIKPRMLSDITTSGCATGACCFPTGACQVMNAAGCASANGTYSGDGSVCDPNTCPPAVGACCAATGACEILSDAACVAQGGSWLGYGSICSPNPCPQPLGSCCFPDGSCIVMREAPCAGAQGVWTMFGVCDPNTCAPPPPPTGSCCYADGTCAVTTAVDCTATWLLAGVCVPNTCVQPPETGSCCYADGTCAVTVATACTATWLLGGTCDPNICVQPPPQGACCNVATGACTITTEADCLSPLVWRGANVPCNAETCAPPTPVERTSWGQIKNTYR